MFLMKLCYLILLAGLAVFYVLYIDNLALILLLCALMIPVILKICLIWLRLSSHVSLHSTTASCTVNEDVPVSVMIENRCPLFFPKAHAFVKVHHAFSDESETLRLRFPLHGKNTTKLTFYARADCCGMIQVSVEKVRVMDYFYLFHTNLKKQNPSMEILVLPQQTPLPLLDTAEAAYAPESNHYANRAGDDPSEIFRIREYHEGDSVSRIHWKLSSKSEKVFIREFGYPIEKQVLLIAEYLTGTASDNVEYMKQAQAFLTYLYSMTVQLCAMHNLTFVLAWYDGQRLIYKPLRDGDSLLNLFREVYHALRHMALDTEILHGALFGQHYSSVTLLTNDSSGELLPVLEKQIDANQKNLLVITEQQLHMQSDFVSLQTISPEQKEPLSDIII